AAKLLAELTTKVEAILAVPSKAAGGTGGSGGGAQGAKQPAGNLLGIPVNAPGSGSGEIDAPDIVADPPSSSDPKDLPKATADPTQNSDFIDKRIDAAGVGLGGTDFILFIDGKDQPIAVPFSQIDFAATKYAPASQVVFASRDEAIAACG